MINTEVLRSNLYLELQFIVLGMILGVRQGSSLKVLKKSIIDQFYKIILSLFSAESINSINLRIMLCIILVMYNSNCWYLLKNCN